jgi:hypothetical protein
MDEHTVSQTVFGGRRADTRDPQAAELPTALTPVTVRVRARSQQGFLRRSQQLATATDVPFGTAEQTAFFLTPSGTVSCSHFSTCPKFQEKIRSARGLGLPWRRDEHLQPVVDDDRTQTGTNFERPEPLSERLAAVPVKRNANLLGHCFGQNASAAEITAALVRHGGRQVAGAGLSVLDFARGRQPEPLFRALVRLLLWHIAVTL